MDNDIFDELLASVEQMDSIVSGNRRTFRRFNFPDPQVKEIRERLGVSQDKFAMILGVSRRTVENWEQGRHQPTGPARSLLKIVDADPDAAMKALTA